MVDAAVIPDPAQRVAEFLQETSAMQDNNQPVSASIVENYSEALASLREANSFHSSSRTRRKLLAGQRALGGRGIQRDAALFMIHRADNLSTATGGTWDDEPDLEVYESQMCEGDRVQRFTLRIETRVTDDLERATP